MTPSPRERLILPFIAPLYHRFAQPVGWPAFRIVIGGLLTVEGWPKIIAAKASGENRHPLSGGPDDVAHAPRRRRRR